VGPGSRLSNSWRMCPPCSKISNVANGYSTFSSLRAYSWADPSLSRWKAWFLASQAAPFGGQSAAHRIAILWKLRHPVGAIKQVNGTVEIDFDERVERTTCIRFAACPVDAIAESPETAQWPREVRRQFSDPMTKHPSTGGSGRGTEDMKTDDVTGRVRRGEVGIGLEFGRPGVGTRLSELEEMSMALAKPE
jgi:hypothetical protein